MTSNTIFIALGIPGNYLEKTTLIRSTLPLAHTKHLLIHHLLQYHCHCTANKSTKLKTSWMVNHQFCWSLCMFLIIKQLFLQSIQSFQNQTYINLTQILKYLTKTKKLSRDILSPTIKQRMSIYNNETKIYPDLNNTAPQEPQTYLLNKLNEIEVYYLNNTEVPKSLHRQCKTEISLPLNFKKYTKQEVEKYRKL